MTLVIATMFLSITAYAGTQAVYYVDPHIGSDSHAGNIDAPFETIERARDIVRTVNDSMTGDIIVHLRGGIYSLSQAITFDAQDSGTNGFRVIYRNYPHEEPILDGGSRISGWTFVSNGIYSADVGSLEFLQLYVNNRPAQRARHPEPGSEHNIIANDRVSKKIRINLSEIQEWSNLNRVQMILATSYVSSHLRIGSFVTNGLEAVVTPMYPERASYYDWGAPIDGTPSYFFENHFDFLDTPGEWFLDIDIETVYYMPRPDENMDVADIVAPRIEKLLHVEGAKDITFFGLTFQHTTWMEPQTNGMAQRQASMRKIATPNGEGGWTVNRFGVLPVAIYFKYVRNLRIERCLFQKMGACAMGFDTGTQSNMVVGNVFSEIADTGIIYDMDNNRRDTGLDRCFNDTLDSNYFLKMGSIYYGGAALFAFWPDSLAVIHNEIAQANGLGMNIGWGATYDTTAFRAPRVMYNRVHDAAVMARDSGGIHMKSDSNGGLYAKNWIYNCYTREYWNTGPTRRVGGIYLDDNTENTTVTSNIFNNIRDDTLIISHLAQNNSLSNNSSQDQTIKDESGIRPEYVDIKEFWRGGAIGRDLEPGEPYTNPAPARGVLFYDTFDSETIGQKPPGYTCDTTVGTIEVVDVPGGGNYSIRLTDDETTGGPVLKKTFTAQSGVVSCEFRIKAEQTINSMFFSFMDANGSRACSVGFSGGGNLRIVYQPGVVVDIATYTPGTWFTYRIEADASKQLYSVWIDNTLIFGDSLFFESTDNITSIRLSNTYKAGVFDIDYIKVESQEALPSLATTNGVPYCWFDQYYDTTEWTTNDFAIRDVSDDDNDGLTAWQEYQANTVPNDSASVPKIINIIQEDGDITFSWKTLRDSVYTLQRSTNLVTKPWINVAAPSFVGVPGNGGMITYQEPTTNTPRSFFRFSVDN